MPHHFTSRKLCPFKIYYEKQGDLLLLYFCAEVPAVLAISLPEKIEERLERLAKRTGRTKAYCARQAIIEHLEDLEDVEIADKRLKNLQAGKTRAIPLSRLLRKYGVDPGNSAKPPSGKPRNGPGQA